MDPTDAVVAVIGVGKHGRPQLLGTGSMIGDGATLLTADHVARDFDGEVGIASMRGDGDPERFPITLIERDPSHDLALYRVDGYTAERPLNPWWEPIGYNRELITFEYSPSRPEGDIYYLSPATRIGHMTRMLDLTDQRGPLGDRALELSFPAVGGASGAPVMLNGRMASLLDGDDAEFAIVGVIVGNTAHHLLPVQVDEYLDVDGKYIAETRFMLPQGLAVNICHLREMYQRSVGPIAGQTGEE